MNDSPADDWVYFILLESNTPCEVHQKDARLAELVPNSPLRVSAEGNRHDVASPSSLYLSNGTNVALANRVKRQLAREVGRRALAKTEHFIAHAA